MAEGWLLALRTTVSLAVVLALLVFFIRWLDKNSNRSARGRANAQAPVEVMSRTALSRGASVQVVRVGGQVLVLGVTDASVNVLTDLGPADFEPAPAAGASLLRSAASEQGAAAENIVATLLRRQGRHRGSDEAAVSADVDRALRMADAGRAASPVEAGRVTSPADAGRAVSAVDAGRAVGPVDAGRAVGVADAGERRE